MDVPILYEDDTIVAIDKPSGMLTCRDDKTPAEEKTVEDWFKKKYPEVSLDRPYVHRLDRETSGVLVFAKNEPAYDFLRKAFTKRDVKKTYLAIVYGALKEEKGSIDFDIGRSRKDFRMRSAQPKARGRLREALTRYEVLGTIGESDEKYALLRIMPETGRTHQIRVHLKAIHHPVVGDPLYAGKRLAHMPFGLNRLALHAASIDLPLPSGGHVTIEAPLPADLASVFSHFEKPIPPTSVA